MSTRYFSRAAGVCAALSTVSATSAHAAESAAASMLSMSVSLIIVLATIAAAAFFFKRMQPGMTGANKALIQPVSQYALGTRERIVVVEMGERWLVLGVTANSINLLAEQPKGELPAMAQMQPAQAFADVLGKLMKKK
jgi:flagellar protein FliO/FliZ